eukprot:scaffold62160_cov13-Tisochrysis_lutea.AAC.1
MSCPAPECSMILCLQSCKFSWASHGLQGKGIWGLAKPRVDHDNVSLSDGEPPGWLFVLVVKRTYAMTKLLSSGPLPQSMEIR